MQPVPPAMDRSHQRRSDRILAPLRIRVSGVNASGWTFEEEAITVSVSQDGACISVLQVLLPGRTLRIRNLENNLETEFRVVGELRRVFGERREWGVESLYREPNIWGVEFEPPPEDVQPKVLICCGKCKNGALCSLSSMEYEVLMHAGVISRHCEPCQETTRWEPGNPGRGEASASPVGQQGAEQRKHKRLKLTMLLRAVDSQGHSELVQALDISKGGVRFLSKLQYRIGEVISLTMPSAEKSVPIEARSRVVRVEQAELGTVYAVKFERP